MVCIKLRMTTCIIDRVFMLLKARSAFRGLEFRNSNGGKILHVLWRIVYAFHLYFSGYSKFVFNVRVFGSYGHVFIFVTLII